MTPHLSAPNKDGLKSQGDRMLTICFSKLICYCPLLEFLLNSTQSFTKLWQLSQQFLYDQKVQERSISGFFQREPSSNQPINLLTLFFEKANRNLTTFLNVILNTILF